MKPLITTELLNYLKIFNDNEQHIEELYNSTIEFLPLDIADYLTIKDIIKLSGYNDISLHLLLISMFLIREQGSLCLEINSEKLYDLLSPFFIDYRNLKSIVENLLTSPIEKRFADIITRVNFCDAKNFDNQYPDEILENLSKPLVLHKSGEKNFLYFHRSFIHEKKLETRLSKLISESSKAEKSFNMETTAGLIIEILENNPLYSSSGKKIKLNKEQKLAVILSILKNFLIISGGPGTGKTSVITAILRCLVRIKNIDGTIRFPVDRIKITAPTGRAAGNISDSIKSALELQDGLDENDKNLKIAISENILSIGTIHRLLNYSPRRNKFLYNQYYHLPVDVLIIDEVSMIDVALMDSLMNSLPSGVKVIFLGDRNQLPSIKAGALLADLIPDKENIQYSEEMHSIIKKYFKINFLKSDQISRLTDRIVLLKENFRSVNNINRIAELINEAPQKDDNQKYLKIIKEMKPCIINCDIENNNYKEYPALGKNILKNNDKGVWFLHPEKSSNIQNDYLKLWNYIYDTFIVFNQFIKNSNENISYEQLVSKLSSINPDTFNSKENTETLNTLFSYLEHWKILTLLKKGPYGSEAINNNIRNRIISRLDKFANENYFNGAPIMITKNDYSKNLYNGDAGIVLKNNSGEYYGVFKRSGSYNFFQINSLNSFELAYAITIHKSQGSEYNDVLLILPPEKHPMMTREIIYTGLTRAKENVFIFAQESLLIEAIKYKIERTSGFDFWN